jgi:hypothetical protein
VVKAKAYEDFMIEVTRHTIFVIPGRAKREPGIHTHGALGPWANRAIEATNACLFFVCRECGEPQARGGYGFRAHRFAMSRND